MGDVIATLPTCRHLAEQFSDRQLVYVTHPAFASLFGMVDFPVKIVPDRQATLPSLSSFFFPSYQPISTDDRRIDTTIDFIDDFAASCGITLEADESPRLHPLSDLLEKIGHEHRDLSKGRSVFVLHTGPTDKVREWPKEKWIELTHLLHEHANAVVIQLGVTYHTRWGKNESNRIHGALDFLDKLSLQETACWIAHSNCFIGIDSGLLQMAAALQVPAVAIMGPTDARFRFKPKTIVASVQAKELDCLGCHHRAPRLHWNTGCPFDIACMSMTEPLEVCQAALSVMRKPAR